MGLRATTQISAFQEILVLSSEHYLTGSMLAQYLTTPLSGSYPDGGTRSPPLSQAVQITLVLLHHLYHPSNTPFLAYLANLPKRPLSPIYTFNSDELSLLTGDPMHSSIQEGQDDLI